MSWARYQALACSGGAIITFIGVCHEFVGEALFPWGPAFLGGPIGWHGLGLSIILTGALLVGGTLGFIRFPVVLLALVAAVVGLFVGVLTAVLHHQFHLFAFTAFLSGVVTAVCHRWAAASAGPGRGGAT